MPNEDAADTVSEGSGRSAATHASPPASSPASDIEGPVAAIEAATRGLSLVQPAEDRPGFKRETADRILDGAERALSTRGARSTSMEDVARAADVTRMTVYRYFASRDELMRAITARQMHRYYRAVNEVAVRARAAVAPCENPALPMLVETVQFAMRYWQEHPIVNALLENDPDQILPYLTLKSDLVLANVVAAHAAIFDAWQSKGWIRAERSDWLADWLGRLVMSWLYQPSPAIDPTDPETIRRLVVAFVWPVLEPEVGSAVDRND
jgi:AcrR family transcriptional regulator